MNEITWLSHGGPGSGRYPKGSGKKRFKNKKTAKADSVFMRSIEKQINVGEKSAIKIANSDFYKKSLIPKANKMAESRISKKGITFSDKKIADLSRMDPKFKRIGNRYYEAVKNISAKTALSENAVKVAFISSM